MHQFRPIETRLAAAGDGATAPSSALLREEIDELRGRVRRAAEDRAALDAEVTTLRRALAEADESVVNLTRKTTAEMSANETFARPSHSATAFAASTSDWAPRTPAP